VCICSLSYPACNAHALCCHLWPVGLYSIFHTFSQKARCSKKVFEIKMRVLNFCKTFVWNIALSEKKRVRCDEKRMSVLTWYARYFCQIAVNLELSRQSFEKYWNTKFYENPSSVDERSDGRTDKTKLMVAFRNSRTCLQINKYCLVPYVNRLGCKSTPIHNFVLSDSSVLNVAGPGITKHKRSVILSL
jgi:hypothetical protein